VLTAQLLGRSESEGTRATLVSCIEATQNLRLIKFMDAWISDPTTAAVRANHTTARGHCLRLFLRGLFEGGFTETLFGVPAGNGPDPYLLKATRTVNVSFYEVVFDSLVTGLFYDRFVDGERAEAMRQAVEALPSGAKSWQLAAEYLGF
jgi:hypothetical protein